MNSFRLISNLPFKLYEISLHAACLTTRLLTISLKDTNQPTNLTTPRNDIFGALDRRCGAIVVAAFDTVNQEILLSRLDDLCGMGGSVLA